MPKPGKLGQIYVAVNARLDKFEKDLKKMKGQAKASSSKVQKTFDKINLKKAGRALLNFKTALVATAGAYGLGRLSKSFLDASRVTENYQLRLQALLGSTEKGTQLFKEMAEFAGRVPFEFREIMSAATQLSGVMSGGIEEIKQWMPLIADLAAVSGLGIQQTTEQVVRMYAAGAASADLFRERGITAMLGFQAGVSYTAEETRKRLIEAWKDPESKFKDATKEMANSWDGMMSMIQDKWFQFRNMIMGSGVYDYLKDRLGEINERFGDWLKTNEAFIEQEVPKYLDGIATSLSTIGRAAAWVVNDVNDLFKVLNAIEKVITKRGTTDILRGWFGVEVAADKPPPLPMLDEAEIKSGFDYWESRYRIIENLDKIRHQHFIDRITMEGEHYKTISLEILMALKKKEEEEEKARKESEQFWRDYHQMITKVAHALDEELIQAHYDVIEALENVETKTSETAKYMEEIWMETARNMQNAFSDFFYDAITGQLDSLRDYINAFVDSMARTVSSVLSSMMWESILGAISTSGTGTAANWSLATEGAKGLVFNQQGLVPFGRGGIIDKPTIFPFARGAGLMGESGPEAIMPLKRTASGDLGVQSEGGGGTNNFYIAAMDSQSFGDFLMRNQGAVVSTLLDASNMGSAAWQAAVKGGNV